MVSADHWWPHKKLINNALTRAHKRSNCVYTHPTVRASAINSSWRRVVASNTAIRSHCNGFVVVASYFATSSSTCATCIANSRWPRKEMAKVGNSSACHQQQQQQQHNNSDSKIMHENGNKHDCHKCWHMATAKRAVKNDNNNNNNNSGNSSSGDMQQITLSRERQQIWWLRARTATMLQATTETIRCCCCWCSCNSCFAFREFCVFLLCAAVPRCISTVCLRCCCAGRTALSMQLSLWQLAFCARNWKYASHHACCDTAEHLRYVSVCVYVSIAYT